MENEIITTAAEAVADTAKAASMFGDITFEPMNFVDNLGYMATGMIGIFVVIGVIIVATSLINKIASRNK